MSKYYTPESGSAKKYLSRYDIELYRSYAEGLSFGRPTEDNPLGLYEIHVSGVGYTSKIHLFPFDYSEMDVNAMESYAVTESETPSPYDAAAGLVMGGLLSLLFEAGKVDTARTAMRSLALRYGVTLTFRFVQKIANEHLAYNPGATLDDLVRAVEQSYPLTAGMVMRLPKDEAHEVETELGLSDIYPYDQNNAYMFSRTEEGRFEISPSIAEETDPIRCPADHIYADGENLTTIVRRRALRVSCALPQLFQADIERSLSSSNS